MKLLPFLVLVGLASAAPASAAEDLVHSDVFVSGKDGYHGYRIPAIERYSLKASGDERNRILWTGPKGPGRAKLVVRVSYDEAETFANERLLSDQLAAYSDLTVLKDKTVGVLWERADYKFITFTRLTQSFLEPK